MSFLGQFIIELLAGPFIDLFRERNRPSAQFPEGEENASLGAVSIFFGIVSLIFGLLGMLLSWKARVLRPSDWVLVAGMTLLAFLGARIALKSGRSAPLVTRRNLGLAKAGVVCSILTFGAGWASVAGIAARSIGWVP